MHNNPTSTIPTPHLLITFALAGPPAGFAAAVAGVTMVFNTPEGVEALLYAFHPIGLALIYAAGIAPALATAAALILLQERRIKPSILSAGITGFLVTLAYGLFATLTAFVPNPMLISLALAGIGAIAAAVSIVIARTAPKILAAAPEAR